MDTDVAEEYSRWPCRSPFLYILPWASVADVLATCLCIIEPDPLHTNFTPEDEGSICLRNVGSRLQDYTVSQPRTSQLRHRLQTGSGAPVCWVPGIIASRLKLADCEAGCCPAPNAETKNTYMNFICSLFNYAISNSACIVSNIWMVVNNLSERMWKEATVA
jgi:hypothetical protein